MKKLARINDIHERLRLRTVATESGCLEWIGQKDDDGYGIVSFRDRPARVHRVVWGASAWPDTSGSSRNAFLR